MERFRTTKVPSGPSNAQQSLGQRPKAKIARTDQSCPVLVHGYGLALLCVGCDQTPPDWKAARIYSATRGYLLGACALPLRRIPSIRSQCVILQPSAAGAIDLLMALYGEFHEKQNHAHGGCRRAVGDSAARRGP